MDHLCEKCGATVEDGRPFCPHCRAPQVRVQIVASPDLASSAPGPDRQTAPDPLERLAYRPTPGSGLFRVALQAGLLGVIASIIPPGLGMMLTGILAALLYHRACGQTLPAAKAWKLGAMAGAVAFAVSSLLTVLTIVLSHTQEQFRDLLLKFVDQHAIVSTPEAQAYLQWLHTPEGFPILLVIFLVSFLITSVLFSAIGCVVGAVLFRERNRPSF